MTILLVALVTGCGERTVSAPPATPLPQPVVLQTESEPPPPAAPSPSAEPTTSSSQPSLSDRYDAVQSCVIESLTQGNPAEAELSLRTVAVEAELSGSETGLAVGPYEQLTWLRWAEGDLAGASASLEKASNALARSNLLGNMSVATRVHQLWIRSFILREMAVSAPPEERAEALSAADKSRLEHEGEASTIGRHDQVATLQLFFAARARDVTAVRAALKNPYLPEEKEPLDWYIMALAHDVLNQRDQADAARANLRSGPDSVMKWVVLRRTENDSRNVEPALRAGARREAAGQRTWCSTAFL